MKSAVLSIGKEIVSGVTLDTNSHFIVAYLYRLGIENSFILSLDDRKNDIVDALHFILPRVDVIITTGGLGPTFDDITLESVAEALNRNLYLDSDAVRFIEDFYTRLYKEGKIDNPGLNEKRKKMAYLIEGCKPLKNSVGAAWGVYVEDHGKHIFCLPGVPREMKPMFENEVLPILKGLTNRVSVVKEILFNINDESVLGNFIDRVMKSHDVYIKSLPTGFDSKTMNVRFTAFGKTEEEANKKIENAALELEKLLETNN